MKFRKFFVLLAFLSLLFIPPTATYAQLGILPVDFPECRQPEDEQHEKDCLSLCKERIAALQGATDQEKADAEDINFILGCAIKHGLVKFWMVPFFITEIVQFLVALAGMVCMLFIVLGGYHYMIGGLTDEKEKGKKTLLYAIMGFVVVLISWMVINIVQTQLIS